MRFGHALPLALALATASAHAHGQGYTDLNFLITELVSRIDHK